MAKYEKTRTYVVAEILTASNSIFTPRVKFSAPKGRAYADIYIRTSALTSKMIKALKVGKRFTFTRFSNQYTTYFAPKA